MARRRTTTAIARYTPPRAAAPIIVVGGPRGGGKRRSGGGKRRSSKRRGHRVGHPQFTTAMAIPAVIGSAVVGWVGAKGYLAKLPEIGGSRMTTLAIAGYALMRFVKHNGIRAAGFGALCVGAFNFGRLQGGGGIAGEDVSGLDDVSGDVEGDNFMGDGSSAY